MGTWNFCVVCVGGVVLVWGLLLLVSPVCVICTNDGRFWPGALERCALRSPRTKWNMETPGT